VPDAIIFWLESIVNASVLLVKNLILFADGLYIPLVLSLNKKDGLVIFEYVGKYETALLICVELSDVNKLIYIY
jgi:hypothetical protein